jgi:hypothetical protein
VTAPSSGRTRFPANLVRGIGSTPEMLYLGTMHGMIYVSHRCRTDVDASCSAMSPHGTLLSSRRPADF